MSRIAARLSTSLAILATMKNWWLPYLFQLGRSRGSTARFRDGDAISVCGRDWRCLPALAQLKFRCGARVREEGSDIDLRFPGPAVFRLGRAGIFWQIGALNEVWGRDDYGLNGRDLTGKTVVDVGGYIGDSALRFAALGAVVHVFEPFATAVAAMRQNLELSGASGKRVSVHPWALATADRRVSLHYDALKGSLARVDADAVGPDEATITTVDARRYLPAIGIERCDLLKMDCEGGEYELIEKGDVLDILDPAEIVMEYHRGSSALELHLERRGYNVQIRGDERIGILFARK